MKQILFIALLLVMSAKETDMSYRDQIKQNQMQAAWQQNQTPQQTALQADPNRGRSAGRTSALEPAWMGGRTALGDRLGVRGSGAFGNYTYLPMDDPTQQRLQQTQRYGTSAATSEQVSARDEVPTERIQPRPAWLNQTIPVPAPAWIGVNQPASRFNPTGLQPGQKKESQFPIINPNQPRIPSGSFIGANGQAVQNANNQAYWLPQNMPMYPSGTFFAGGGSQVAGPMYPGDQAGGGGNGGFGTNYGWGGGGSGGWGGGGGGYSKNWSPDMGLFSWNYKG